MPYLVSTHANISTVAPNRTITTLLQHALSGLECRYVATRVVYLPAGTPTVIPLEGITRLKLLAVQSTDTTRIDVSVSATSSEHFTTAPADFTMHVWKLGVVVYELKLHSSTATDVQVCLAGD